MFGIVEQMHETDAMVFGADGQGHGVDPGLTGAADWTDGANE